MSWGGRRGETRGHHHSGDHHKHCFLSQNRNEDSRQANIQRGLGAPLRGGLGPPSLCPSFRCKSVQLFFSPFCFSLTFFSFATLRGATLIPSSLHLQSKCFPLRFPNTNSTYSLSSPHPPRLPPHLPPAPENCPPQDGEQAEKNRIGHFFLDPKISK